MARLEWRYKDVGAPYQSTSPFWIREPEFLPNRLGPKIEKKRVASQRCQIQMKVCTSVYKLFAMRLHITI